MTKQRASEASERCEAATPGPWEKIITEYSWAPNADVGRSINSAEGRIVGDRATPKFAHRPEQQANFEFISHARADLPDALDMLERAMKTLKTFLNRDHDEGTCGYLISGGTTECYLCRGSASTEETVVHETNCMQPTHDAAHALLREWEGR